MTPPRLSTRAAPLRALRVSVVLLLLACLAGYLSRDHYLTYRARQRQLAQWQQQQAFERRLDRLVEMKFEREPTLEDWLAEWSRQAEVPCRIVADPQAGARQRRIALTLKPTSAQGALQSLSRIYDMGWTIAADGAVDVFPGSTVDDPLHTCAYPLPAEWGAAQQQVAALRSYAAMVSDSTVTREGMLICIERHPAQLQVAAFLRRLGVATAHAQGLARQSGPLDPAAWQPFLLDDEPAALEQAVAALKRPVTIDVHNVSLTEFARALSRALDYPVIVDPRLAADHKRLFGDAPLSCRLQNAALADVLKAALPQRGLTAEPVVSGRVLALYSGAPGPSPIEGICLAYPVADLLPVGQGQFVHEPLLEAIYQLVDEGHWHAAHGIEKIGGGPCGPLLVVTQSWRTHQQLQALLKALREAKGGLSGAIARSQRAPPLPAAIDQALERTAALKYQYVPLREVAADLKTRFDLQLVLPEENKNTAETKVWCHLPERPLRENLRHLLNAYGLTLTLVQGQLRVLDSYEAQKVDYAPLFEFEVYNLRSFQGPGRDVVREVEWLLHEFGEEYNWRSAGGEGRVVRLDNLLIFAHRPQQLNETRLALQALREHYQRSPAEVREAALRDQSRPLIDHDRILAVGTDTAWNDELNRRLAARDSLEARDAKMLPLLWQLAEKHGLPIVSPGSPWTDVDPLGEVTFSVQDEPVRDILQRLLSKENAKRWLVGDGLLQTWDEPLGTPNYQVNWLFDVSDLLQPGGLLLPGQLYRTLTSQAFTPSYLYSGTRLKLHLGRFLAVHSSEERCDKVRQALHALRTKELQPSLARPGDTSELPDLKRWEKDDQDDLELRFRIQDAGGVLEGRAQP